MENINFRFLDSDSIRFDVFLTDYFKNDFNYKRTKLSDAIEKGIFLVNQKKQKPSYKLKLNDIISFDKNELDNFLNPEICLEPYDFKLDIIYEDDDIIVLNKPKGILTHPTKFEQNKTLSNALLFHTKGHISDLSGKDRLGIVHRLDKNTSGIMIAAKNNISHKNLSDQIKNKTLKRKYLAIALGVFEKKQDTINKSLVHYLNDDVKMKIASDNNSGLSAITKYRVIEQFKSCALVELELKTGRTHQIRVHLASINHPVFGDNLYGAKGFYSALKGNLSKIKTQDQLLQSYYISFIHPKTKEKMEFTLKEKDFSKDFIKVLNILRSKENEY